MFLLVLAYPGCPGSKAIKRSLYVYSFSQFASGKLNLRDCVFCCSLTPHRSESFNLESVVISENFPLTAVSLFATAGPQYTQALAQVVSRANNVYGSFMKSEEGLGFSGQVSSIACALPLFRCLFSFSAFYSVLQVHLKLIGNTSCSVFCCTKSVGNLVIVP